MRNFLARLFSMEEINGNNICPTYLYRWTLLRVGKSFAIYLHKFVGDDWSLDLHDHPKRFWSIGLWGSYTEITPRVLTGFPGNWRPYEQPVCRCKACWPPTVERRFVAPWIRTFPADHIHRLVGPTPAKPCWTLVIVGPAVREWGFWLRGAFIPWRRYVHADDVATRRSCP